MTPAKTMAEVRDGLLMSTNCRSKYKQRGDKCRYCEVDFTPGKSCPHKELIYRHKFEDKTGMGTYDGISLDILTYAALANWPKYAAYIGEDALRAEVLQDMKKRIPASRLGAVVARYPFLREQ